LQKPPPFIKNYWLSATVYLVAYLVFYSHFRHYFIPDALYYADTADAILNGRWTGAVNGYWSPMLSWLLVPVKLIVKDSIISLHIVNFCCGLVILVQVNKLLQFLFNRTDFSVQLLTATLAPVVAGWCAVYLTADPLFTALLLWYFRWCLQKKYLSHPLQTGLLGAFLYFAKPYGFFFFIVHLAAAYLFAQKVNKKHILSFLKAISAFLCCAVVWIALLFARYHRPVLATSGAYNHAIMQSGRIVHPCDSMKLIVPNKPYYRSSWNEVTEHVNYKDWSLLGSSHNIQLQANIVTHNVIQVYNQLQKMPRYGLWLLAVLLAAATLLKLPLNRYFIILSAVTFIIFCSGYLLFFTEERYFIFASLLLCLLLIYLSERIMHHFKVPALLLPLGIAFIAGKPAYDLYRLTSRQDETIVYEVYQKLQPLPTEKQRFASFEPYRFINFSYYTNWQDYGGLKGYKTDSIKMLDDLTRYQIGYLFMPAANQLPANVQQQYAVKLYQDSIVTVWGRNYK
jgi:hypothetical protein